MAISLDYLEKKDIDNAFHTNPTFSNPYKELLEKSEVFEKHIELIPETYIKQHEIITS